MRRWAIAAGLLAAAIAVRCITAVGGGGPNQPPVPLVGVRLPAPAAGRGVTNTPPEGTQTATRTPTRTRTWIETPTRTLTPSLTPTATPTPSPVPTEEPPETYARRNPGMGDAGHCSACRQCSTS